ncbi:hypothetical protein [Polyangium jinanense]|uniref:Cytochrome c domain-containing protein n=1 Tax=Polyangium jinanense TaxID=2829994 RepID=A0A9X3XA10_9BACT|nr:hypothetical protein [Polyangium jinanense]MDC3984076.1 hypothetical protein [Polyangium jinanense]
MKQATAWFVLALILAYGCVAPPTGTLGPTPPGNGGSGDAGGPPDDYFTAKELFDLNVYPILASKCTPCHTQGANSAPIWLGAEESSSYAKIEGYPKPLIAHPDNSLLRLKGEHTGPALAVEDDTLLTEWLLKEVDERGLFGDPTFEPDPGAGGAGGEGGAGGAGGGGGGGPVSDTTLLEALEEFGACMQWKDWESTGMVNLPDQPTAAGACKACHFAGMGGNWLSGDSAATFEKNRLFPYILKIAVGTVDETGAFMDLVPARRHIDKGKESQMCDQEPCHPMFLLSPEMETAVENFFLLSYARWKQGLCEP